MILKYDGGRDRKEIYIMKLNKKKLAATIKNYNIGATTIITVIDEMRSKIEFLYTHNKNLTKEQYYAIEELRELINAIEE